MSVAFVFYSLLAVAQLALFVRWLYRRIRDEELMHTFIRDMAQNHLPHIYNALRRLCREKGIDLPEEPHIQWVDLTGPKY
ncbi:MAG: hypothetical protein ACRD50_14155 [Candidatus Acidiferrales bacterium]